MQMPEDPTQLAGWIQDKKREREDFYKGRKQAWEFDRALLLQRYRRKIQGQANITSAEPRNAVRLALDIMTRRDVRFQVMINDQDADEEVKINDTDRFVNGLWRGTDRTWRTMGGRSFLRDLDWYIVMGGYATAPLVFTDGNGKTKFATRVLDPIDVFPDYDDQGVWWVCHAYMTTVKEATPRWEDKSWDLDSLSAKSERDEVEVINAFWIDETKDGKGVYNAITIDGHVVKEATHEKQFGMRLPLPTGPASGQPMRHPLADINNNPSIDWTATAWEGILAPARETFADFDSLLSYAAEIVRRNALGRYVQNTRNGMPKVTPQQFRNAELITMGTGEGILPVPPPTSPAERNQLLEYFSNSIQRSTLSYTAFGALGIEISGVTLESLNTATQSVLSPFLMASQYCIEETMMSYIDQFRLGKFKPISVEVKGKGTQVAERWFVKDYKRSDIPKSVLLTAQQALALPDTTLARLNAARTAYGDNRQMMSSENIDEKLIPDLVPDHALNNSQMTEDRVRNAPQVDALTTIEGLRQMAETAEARGDHEMAKMALQIIQSTLAQFEQQFAGQQQAVAGIDAQRQAQAGASITEPRPQDSPPEASGVPGEQVDARAGNPAITTLLERRASRVN